MSVKVLQQFIQYATANNVELTVQNLKIFKRTREE
ncbi:hypothetical protein CcarbDRAFT_1933 [Clostridium carboxidivorans P7]|uniref:Uncharacterized protein n=1 Tax=Clostridium carboxidivorans P7 TaxID=536227 RepID=C6PT16_9CLOT|nr:hypothetical protein CcarbDRAFT_1933 [Clostridium carboxidivorans P7]